MSTNPPPPIASEGTQREQLAAYFLSAPPMAEQTAPQRREYLQQLSRLGQLERQDILREAGCTRPLVWGNPAPLIQSLLSAAQRLAAGLGQPLLIFPARETAIGAETLLHPRLLSVALCDLLCAACRAAPRQPVWVRLQEQRGGLAVAVTAATSFVGRDTTALIKECTKLHGGSLVHCEETLVFTCGQAEEPPTGVRLYGCPTEEDLLTDTLSPLWSVFYAALHQSFKPSSSAEASMRSTTATASAPSDHSGSSSFSSTEGEDKL